MELMCFFSDSGDLFRESKQGKAWAEWREVALQLRLSWGSGRVKFSRAVEKIEIIFLHRDQIHTQRWKRSCPPNFLNSNTYSLLAQEPNLRKELAKSSSLVHSECLSTRDGWQDGHPCGCRLHEVSFSGEEKNTHLCFGWVFICWWL